MESSEFEKSKIFIIVGLDHYVDNGVFMKTILKRPTGNVSAVFIDRGEQITENLSRFDHFIQIIEGKAEVQIDDHSFSLISGESIIIPAHSKNTIRANERFKMISTIIKSGYE
ncbi:cupin domain-containing protein [Gelidibacter gilvus]|uniref:Cupin n=1 Tax=Gelidibacter gilvus TaxID=59602 RepID=A0A4Q0XEQ2_9FLAO|nr:cupin domain-containing protein [Gelidibacter gilvus]RXJ49648.1 cupin [Gelidibacter gilvus]